MRNLAGDSHCDASIRDELEAVNVPLIKGEASKGEVPATLAGSLGPFTFRRAWYYWVVYGPMPLAIAEELYADPIGANEVRAGGDCGCRPPNIWADHFDGDRKKLLPTDGPDHKLIQDKPWSPGIADILVDIERTCRFVPDPRAYASRSFVYIYHIDSARGLRLFVDTVRKHGIAP